MVVSRPSRLALERRFRSLAGILCILDNYAERRYTRQYKRGGTDAATMVREALCTLSLPYCILMIDEVNELWQYFK